MGLRPAAASFFASFFAACNIALRTFSKSKLLERLEATGRGNRLDRLIAQTPDLILMTGMVRAVLNMITLLAVFAALQPESQSFGRENHERATDEAEQGVEPEAPIDFFEIPNGCSTQLRERCEGDVS